MNALAIGTSSVREVNGLYSLNDCHRAAGGEERHQPAKFVRLEQTKALIEALSKSPEMANCAAISNAGISAIEIHRGAHGGTYACRELVIAYAAWISAAFHLKVIRVFLAAQAATPSPQLEINAPAPAPMAALAAAGVLAGRFLVNFGGDGTPRVQVVPPAACVMTPEDCLAAITRGDLTVPPRALADFVSSAVQKLARLAPRGVA